MFAFEFKMKRNTLLPRFFRGSFICGLYKNRNKYCRNEDGPQNLDHDCHSVYDVSKLIKNS